MMHRIAGFRACRLLAVWTAIAFAAVAPAQTLNDVEYARVGGEPLLLDFLEPTDGSPGPWPLIIYIHGGGWTSGTHNPPYAPYLSTARASGFAVASVQYRLTSEAGLWGTESVTFPAQIHDVKGAIRYLRKNAALFDVDPARFAAWGPSAGGHLAALVGTSGDGAAIEGTIGGNNDVSSRVQAVVDYYGPTDILNMQLDVRTPPGSSLNHDAPNSAESKLIGFSGPGEGIGVLRANQANPNPPFPELMVLVSQVNPITWVSPDDPPFFIVHGENDVVVPILQSQRLSDALTSGTVAHTFTRVPGMGHNAPPTEYSAQAIAFLVSALGAGSTDAGEGWVID